MRGVGCVGRGRGVKDGVEEGGVGGEGDGGGGVGLVVSRCGVRLSTWKGKWSYLRCFCLDLSHEYVPCVHKLVLVLDVVFYRCANKPDSSLH